ncbi:MAG: ammonium transporter [Leptospira sp.]|nr:ammonium transporter [Leptospira sp.]
MIKTNFDILWIIFSSGLVFFMQAGFLCLESGLTRTKNSINVAIKNITDFGIATAVFYTLGFGIMYGESFYGFFGTNSFLPNFGIVSPEIPVFFIFQLMFCGTAATIVSGAVAERMKFGAYIIVTIIISALIYPLFGHWAWGKNLSSWNIATGWLAKLGFIDFAGSTVVHSLGGWVGLVAMSIIGPREGKYSASGEIRNITGHSLPIAMLGTLILWFGWIGFNGGSTLAFSGKVPGIIANTMLSAAGGLGAALIYGWKRLGYAEATLPLNGALAGLVSITASCHAVTSAQALLIGIVGGILMFETRPLLDKFKMDDAVGAIPVHLTGGIWGTLAVGLFGNLTTLGTGLSRVDQILIQLTGIVCCSLNALFISYLLLKLINHYYPLRVSSQDEYEGLNFTEHRATTELTDLFLEMEYQKRTGDLSKDISVEPFTEVGQIAERYNLVLKKIRIGIEERDQLTKDLQKNLSLIQSDLLTAKKIQKSIIAENDKKIQGLNINARYLPLTEVGGDFYDISEVKPGVTRIFLADTTGHGVQAALMTMAIKTLYESLKRKSFSVAEILYYLNNEFLDFFGTLNQFLTCIIIEIDINKNQILYSSAGHIPQYLVADGKLIRLEKTGRLLGVKKNAEHESKILPFAGNSKLFLFTDGISESWNHEKIEYGDERIEMILSDSNNAHVSETINRLLDDQKLFLAGEKVEDDITIIGIEKEN